MTEAWGRGFPCEPLAQMSDALCVQAGCADIDVVSGGLGCLQSQKTLMDVSRLVVRLTNGQFTGLCLRELRPCRSGCSDPCACDTPCLLRDTPQIVRVTHPSWAPIHQVLSVWVDGGPLPVTAWRLLARSSIERTDGGVWPTGTNRGALGDPGTWGVVAKVGRPAPDDLRRLIAAYACDLAHQCPGGADCGDGSWPEFDAWVAAWKANSAGTVPALRTVRTEHSLWFPGRENDRFASF